MKNYEIIFPNDWDELAELEIEQKGYCNQLKVKVGESIYSVFFVTMTRLLSDFEYGEKRGKTFWAETNTVVIADTTLPQIIACLDKLEDDIFDGNEKERSRRILRESPSMQEEKS
ncbi:MAG: hypothetical protein EOO88_43805 [Pedobacter sp.]|nr:MAG: hypothetical protein EOO88_43805 [Pedobacter sp.]